MKMMELKVLLKRMSLVTENDEETSNLSSERLNKSVNLRIILLCNMLFQMRLFVRYRCDLLNQRNLVNRLDQIN